MNWEALWRPQTSLVEVVFRSTFIFLFVHVGFRILGRKEWTRYSTFNVSILFLIAVALRMTLVGNDTSLTAGLVSLVTMLFVDWLLSYLTYKSASFSKWINGPIRPLIVKGVLNTNEMRKARMSKDSILSELRLRGHWDLNDVEEALLERNGQISFKLKTSSEGSSTVYYPNS